ncbi:hypothetical protein BC751_2000 [Cecembia calidifontis]|uniref:Uncharacterized protein n=1 Tax=Cecembia calidifontis TaxID=1187080 RepID=A0A4V2F6I4_9BACT|nr:hypothetical protein BC751_2000 [Cecembia calidifontis]
MSPAFEEITRITHFLKMLLFCEGSIFCLIKFGRLNSVANGHFSSYLSILNGRELWT